MINLRKSVLTVLALLASTVMAAASTIIVYKNPLCGCCHDWAEAARKAGYEVTEINLEDLSDVRAKAGVPAAMEGCHMALVDGYFLEGHVPLEALAKLLSERPEIAGIATPGMPQGSVGMGDDPDAVVEAYAVPKDAAASPSLYYKTGG